jgi:hypothetical protein
MEVGLDVLVPRSAVHPSIYALSQELLFNAKIGIPEGGPGTWAPAVNLGIFNVGTQPDVTTMHIVNVLVGKSLGPLGRALPEAITESGIRLYA